MPRRRKHLVCPVAADGYHVWQSPPAKHDLGQLFAECRICGAVLWTPRGVVVSDGHRDMVHDHMATPSFPQEGGGYPQEGAVSPQHIAGDVAASPDGHDDADAQNT